MNNLHFFARHYGWISKKLNDLLTAVIVFYWTKNSLICQEQLAKFHPEEDDHINIAFQKDFLQELSCNFAFFCAASIFQGKLVDLLEYLWQ